MAYTKIWNIKRTLNKAIAYIENSEKTDSALLVSGYNCNPEMAHIEFEMTALLARDFKGDYSRCGGDENIAHHMIQSFAPYDKITPEEAHRLGKQWADEFLGGKYAYVISTHVDKGQIHNHVIFNATSFYDFKKFHNYKVDNKLRRVSDEICAENDLYVIPTKKRKGKSYYEWQQSKKNKSWKDKIEQILINAIEQSDSYEDFLQIVKNDGVEIQNAYQDEGSHIKFKLSGQIRYVRGLNIGEGFEREEIERKIQISKERRRMSLDNGEEYAVTLEYESRGTKYERTKELALTLAVIRQQRIQQLSDFQTRLNDVNIKISDLNKSIKDVDNEIQDYKRVAKYLHTYQKYLPIKEQSEQVGVLKKKRFLSEHKNELEQFNYAFSQIAKLEISSDIDVSKLIELIKNKKKNLSLTQTKLKQAQELSMKINKANNVVNEIINDPNKNISPKKTPIR